MTPTMQEVYRDIYKKFQHDFPLLHAIMDLVQTTRHVFEKRKKPALLVERAHYENPQDYECHSIQHDFAKKSRQDLSYQDCSMFLIDALLITDEAFLHYLPRVVYGVFCEGNDQTLFLSRLQTIDRSPLTAEEVPVIQGLLRAAQELEVYWQSVEDEEVASETETM